MTSVVFELLDPFDRCACMMAGTEVYALALDWLPCSETVSLLYKTSTHVGSNFKAIFWTNRP